MNDPFKIVSDNTGIWDAQSGEWFDYNEPLPEHDPYWAYAQIGLAILSWTLAAAALLWCLS